MRVIRDYKAAGLAGLGTTVMVLECPSACENLVHFLEGHGGRFDKGLVAHHAAGGPHAACSIVT